MTISDAYSHDWLWRSMRRSAAAVIARIPQWMSVKPAPYIRLRIHVVSGVPKNWWSLGIAPGSMYPRKRLPITNSSPRASWSTKGFISRKSYVRSQSPMMIHSPRRYGWASM